MCNCCSRPAGQTRSRSSSSSSSSSSGESSDSEDEVNIHELHISQCHLDETTLLLWQQGDVRFIRFIRKEYDEVSWSARVYSMILLNFPGTPCEYSRNVRQPTCFALLLFSSYLGNLSYNKI